MVSLQETKSIVVICMDLVTSMDIMEISYRLEMKVLYDMHNNNLVICTKSRGNTEENHRYKEKTPLQIEIISFSNIGDTTHKSSLCLYEKPNLLTCLANTVEEILALLCGG